jgi:hypothetical protein
MIQAFDKRAAAALAAHWTEEGEFVHNAGEPIRGRAKIQKGYALTAQFSKTRALCDRVCAVFAHRHLGQIG